MENDTWYQVIMDEGSSVYNILNRRINYIADDLCRRHVAGLGASDKEDVVQDLWLALCNCGDKYNPERGAVTTFCYQKLLSAANLLIRKRLADTRLVNLRTRPILIDPEEALQAGAVCEQSLRAEPAERTQFSRSEVYEFVERQDEPVRTLLLRFLRGDITSLAEMARECGLPKTTFMRRVFEPFRRRFLVAFGESGE